MLLDATRLVWRRWAGRHPTGIDRVCLAYLRHFGGTSQAVVHHRHFRRILDSQASAALFELLDDPANFRRELLKGLLRFGRRAKCDGKHRLYLNIGHTGLGDDGFRRWVGASAVRPVYFVHDLIPITHPQFCRAGECTRHEERMRAVLKTGTGVIGNSEATLDSLAEFGRGEGLPSPPELAAWLGTTPLRCRPEPTAKPDRPTFVVLGTIEARKNHLMLLQIWARLIEDLGEGAPRLLIIGQRGWKCEQVFDLLDRSETLRTAVTELGQCADEALAGHLANARALLFPSLAEGYGLPLAEALAAGTPVIASDLPVFREIGQGVPDLLDPLDSAAWRQTILSYAEDTSAARSAQMQRLRGYKAPTWGDHFTAVENWLSAL